MNISAPTTPNDHIRVGAWSAELQLWPSSKAFRNQRQKREVTRPPKPTANTPPESSLKKRNCQLNTVSAHPGSKEIGLHVLAQIRSRVCERHQKPTHFSSTKTVLRSMFRPSHQYSAASHSITTQDSILPLFNRYFFFKLNIKNFVINVFQWMKIAIKTII